MNDRAENFVKVLHNLCETLKDIEKIKKKIDEEEVDYHLDYWFILSASHRAFTSLKRFETDAENLINETEKLKRKLYENGIEI